MYRTALALVTLLPSLAWAGAPKLDFSWPNQPSFQDGGTQGGVATSGSARESSTARKFDMEVNFRGRYLWVPRSIIDIWYFRNDWAGAPGPRPFMHGYSLGLEFVIKGNNANGIFYVDWLESLMKGGYWDDKESPPNHQDGEYIVPTPTLGIFDFGADYAYEAYFVRTSQTNGVFGLSLVVGGGLGVGFLVGQLERWTALNGSPAYARFAAGVPFDDYKQIPKVYPMVDINVGLRFNFADRFMLRIEGGLHTLLYGGATLGIMF